MDDSGVIVSKEHRETVFDLSEDEWKSTFELLQEVLHEDYKVAIRGEIL